MNGIEKIRAAKKLYVYGCGWFGKNVFNKLRQVFPEKMCGYVVSKKKQIPVRAENEPEIFCVSDLAKDDKNALFVVAVTEKNMCTVLNILTENGFSNYAIYNKELNSEIDAVADKPTGVIARLLRFR